MKVIITPTARRHLEEKIAWWDENRSAARVRVEDAFDHAVAAISRWPERARVYEERPRYRTMRMQGTPYSVFYRLENEGQVALVAAIWSPMQEGLPPLD